MTRAALLLRVRSGQGKLRHAVVETGPPCLRSDIVTLEAIGGKSCREVVRVLRVLVVGLMTGIARDGNAAIAPPGCSGMAFIAGRGDVGSEEREPRLVVELTHVCDCPRAWTVTTGAFGSELSKMRVGVTTGAFRAHGGELHPLMTGDTGDGTMLSIQRKSRAGMVEFRVRFHLP